MTFDEWWVSHPIKDLKVGPDDVKAAWDAAIAAERERAAKIAEGFRDDSMQREILHDIAGHPKAAVTATTKANEADLIAAAIRGGKP